MSAYKIINDGVGPNPVISIAIRSYKHEKYIGQAIESVFMQKTDYTYEIVIGEDCSPDNTRKVLLEYQQKYPKKIRLILQDNNVGHNKNQMALVTNVTGKYVAFLDGDDYWTDPNKLQKLVSFLEKNKDFSCCFHDAKVQWGDKFEKDTMLEVPDVTTIFDLATNDYIRISSFVFRNHLIKDFPKEIETISGDDYFHFMLVAQFGKIKKFHEVMSVYRRHDDTMSTAMDNISRYKNMIKNVEVMFPYFNEDVRKVIKEHHAEKVLQFANFLGYSGLLEQEKEALLKMMSVNMDAVVRKIVIAIYGNKELKKEQKSIKSNLKNILNILKGRIA